MARKKLFTIGYEQTPAKAVLDELEQAGVKLLVDVRAVAASRRPGFSKNQLAAGLDERGISYLHLRGLGTPKDGREAARSGKFDTLRKIYAKHLKTTQAKQELANPPKPSSGCSAAPGDARSDLLVIFAVLALAAIARRRLAA